MKMNIKQGKLLAGLKSLHSVSITSSMTSPSLPSSTQYTYKFSETNMYQCHISQPLYAQLSHLYPQITIQSVVQQFQHYLALPTQMLGKRSSQILISSNRKYCMKLMDNQSIQKFIAIWKDISQYRHKNKYTYLIDIYRIYAIQSNKQNFRQIDYFILMPCLNPKFQHTVAIYDIKGYTQSRCLDVSQFSTFKFGKDMNFVNSKEINHIRALDKHVRDQFVEIFSNDVRMLESLNILDYSLLINFRINSQEGGQQKVQKIGNYAGDIEQNINKKYHNNTNNAINNRQIKLKNGKIIMQWAIIDYFQEYNNKKKAENKVKSLFRKQVSSVQPQIYGQRFIAFIHQQFIDEKCKQ